MRLTDISMSKFEALLCLLLHLQIGFSEPECECKIHVPVPQKPESDMDRYRPREAPISVYLHKFAELEKQEVGQDSKCCRNYAEIFGDGAMDLCPKTLAEVAEELKFTMAYGGKIGQDVMLTSRFVIKQAAPHEIKSIDLIISSKKKAFEEGEKPGPSMLAPVCRKLIVDDAADPEDPESKVFTVMPLVGIKDARMFPDEVRFDLKGNCKAKNRWARPYTRMGKDVNFKQKFPGGLYIKDKKKREYFQTALVNDANMLKEHGIMDHSLLLHAVETCPAVIEECADVYEIDARRNDGGAYRYKVVTEYDYMGHRDGRYVKETVEKEYKLGIFRKTCSALSTKNRDGRPVYSNGKKMFLYYHNSAWRIGPNISASDKDFYATTTDRCPTADAQWTSRLSRDNKDENVTMGVFAIAESVDMSEEGIMKANKRIGKNLAFAISPTSKKTYAISYTLIDYFLHEDAKGNSMTHRKNTLGVKYVCSGLPFGSSDCCGQNMPDPLDAAEFHSRLLMMIGHSTGADCLKRGGSYWRYFPNVMKPKALECDKTDPNCKTLCEHLGLRFDVAAKRCTEFEKIFDRCGGWFHRFAFLVDAVPSSQSHIEDVMVSNMFGDDVMVAIEDIKRNMARQEMDEVEKYRPCHEKLMNIFVRSDGVRYAAGPKAKSITVAGCSKAAQASSQVMASLKGIHDNVDLGSIELVASAEVIFYWGDLAVTLANHPKIKAKGLSEKTIDGLKTLLMDETSDAMFYAIDVLGKVDDRVKEKALGFRSKKLADCPGWWKIYVADFTDVRNDGTTRDHLEHTPDEIDAYLYTEMDYAIEQEMKKEDGRCPSKDPLSVAVPGSDETPDVPRAPATDETPDDPSMTCSARTMFE
jgi:hypothetical protein